MTEKLNGPIVLWSKTEDGTGYTPSNHPDARDALANLKGGDWYITGPEVEIGVVKRKAAPTKKKTGGGDAAAGSAAGAQAAKKGA